MEFYYAAIAKWDEPLATVRGINRDTSNTRIGVNRCHRNSTLTSKPHRPFSNFEIWNLYAHVPRGQRRWTWTWHAGITSSSRRRWSLALIYWSGPTIGAKKGIISHFIMPLHWCAETRGSNCLTVVFYLWVKLPLCKFRKRRESKLLMSIKRVVENIQVSCCTLDYDYHWNAWPRDWNLMGLTPD